MSGAVIANVCQKIKTILQPSHISFHVPNFLLSVAYQTKSGRTKFTLLIDAQDVVQLTRVRIRTHKGGHGAKHGIIFLLPW